MGREERTTERGSRAGRSNSGEAFRPRGRGIRCAKALANLSRGRGTLGTNAGELDRAQSAGHRASTADRHGRAPAKVKLAEHRAQWKIGHGDGCLTLGRSSGRLGAVSVELDGRERGRGSPAAAGGVGRARERVKLCEMR
jgi:hypothetical protein